MLSRKCPSCGDIFRPQTKNENEVCALCAEEKNELQPESEETVSVQRSEVHGMRRNYLS